MDFLLHPETNRILTAALQEDIGTGDHTSLSTIPKGTQSRAKCLIKDTGVLAGTKVAQRVFELLEGEVVFDQKIADGTWVKPGDIAFYLEGDVQAILMGERLALNFMQRMSGIATQTRKVVELIEDTGCRLLDTRKTTPLVRHMEKWAVHIGGAVNHRFGLYDMILIKDNHIDYAGGIPQALAAARAYLKEKGLSLHIEIETRSLEEVEMVLQSGGAYRILLDNMSPDTLRKAVQLIDGKCQTEASGGITLETVREVALTGVDFISMGALTHSFKSLDISLKAV
ncbi:MAG: carboxylating nicotinate-nucleotide diphosphorylase [Bacteroidota bacterium]